MGKLRVSLFINLTPVRTQHLQHERRSHSTGSSRLLRPQAHRTSTIDDGEPERASGAHVPAPRRHRPPQGLQRVRVRQHDGDQHPGAPGRGAAGAHHAGVQGHLPPGPLPPPLHGAQREPQEGDASVGAGPRGPRRHHPQPVPQRRHHRPARRHGGDLLPHAVAAADHEAGLPRPLRLLPRAGHHRAHLRRPPEASAGVPGDPAVRGPGGGPVGGGARRQGAVPRRREAAGHRRAGLHPRLHRAQLGAPRGRRRRLPPPLRALIGKGREERDVGDLRVRAADHPPVRREPGEVFRQGAAQGDEGAGHQRHDAHTGGGHQGGGGHAVHQGRVPQEVQALARRRHPLRDLRQLPDLPPLPRRPRPLTSSTHRCHPMRDLGRSIYLCISICFFRLCETIPVAKRPGVNAMATAQYVQCYH